MSALKALFGFAVMISVSMPVLAVDALAPALGAAKATATVTASTPMPMPVVQPKFEEYVSTMLIVGKWGEKPGEYQYTIWEGSYDWPRQFVVTDNEHIYILDQINNRVQHYNADGKLLEMIRIASYKLANEAEIKSNNGLIFSVVSIDRLRYIGSRLYASGSQYHKNGWEDVLWRLEGKSFKKVTTAKERSIFEKEIADPHKAVRTALQGDRKFEVKVISSNAGTREELLYNGISLLQLLQDKDVNIWARSRNSIRKYSPKGDLLFEMPLKYEQITVSKSGNLYLMSLYPPKKDGASGVAFEDAYEGISVRKYYLKQPVK